jgi:hypothetical protein
VVRLTEVESEAEAATIVGYLESRGIRATYVKGGSATGLSAYSGPGVGGQEILVDADNLDAARTALADIDQAESAQ